MSTRRDGLSLAIVSRTVRYVLDAHQVDVVGGNRRVLHLRRRDGAPEVAAAPGRHGRTLQHVLGIHGFTVRTRRGVVLVDLLECPAAGATDDLADLVADQVERETRDEWLLAQQRGEEPPGRSASEAGSEAGDEIYRWARTETAARLRHWLAAPAAQDVAMPPGWEDRAVERARDAGVI